MSDKPALPPADFARIADATPAPMWVTGLDRRRSFVNRAYVAFLGTDAQAALDFDWRTIIHPDDLDRIVGQSIAGEASLQPFTLEGRYRRGDGAWRWLRSVSQPHFGPAGEHVGFIGVAHDVTDTVEATAALRERERELRDSERRLRLAVEGARIGTWEWEPAARRGHWSRRTAEIMGVPYHVRLSAEEQGALIHPADRARVAAGTARLIQTGTDFTDEYRIIRPDGAVRWISSHGVIERDAAGVAVRAIGTLRDITARREAQEQLEALAATLEAQVAERTAERDRMWRLSRELLMIVGRDRRVKAANPALAGLGYSADEVIGRPLIGFVHPDDRAAAIATIRAGARRPVAEFHTRLRAADGGWRCYAWSAAPGDGEAYVIGRDVTAEMQRLEELAAAQEQLRQAQKMDSLGQLTGGVAHDFNNLLTPILGSLDLLSRADTLSPRQRRLVEGALEAADRARLLVQRLLAFARRQPLNPGPVDLAALLDGLGGLIASTLGPRVAVTVAVAPGLPPAIADANQLELALLNLVVNARDAMPDGGTLTLAVADAGRPADLPPGRYLALGVADTGTGMDADTAARAVEPFFSTKEVGRGTGLGLSMVDGLASQLGGAMRLETRPGAGTRVTLILPVAEAPAIAPPVPAPVAAAGAGRILLVDDEAGVRDATAAMLASLGYDVVTATSGAEALDRLDAGIDLLVTDHLMPGMTGAELARAAALRRPRLRILLVSGYAALEQIPPHLPRLAKPFRLDELARALAAL